MGYTCSGILKLFEKEIMSDNYKPLISCTCITFQRSDLIQRAISCFRAQTYGPKEMIIVYEDSDLSTHFFLETITAPDIIKYAIPSEEKWSLGKKRNFAIEKSNGTFFCQWDDDDWYHQQRLQLQMDAIIEQKKEASILLNSIIFDSPTAQAFVTSIGFISASLMCSKNAFKRFKYSDQNVSEDEAMVWGLLEFNLVHPMIRPEIYIYVYHGRNTMIKYYFDRFYADALKLSPWAHEQIVSLLNQQYSVDEASNILSSKLFQSELAYFNWFTKVDEYYQKLQMEN